MSDSGDDSRDLTKAYLPFLTTISLVLFVAWGTFIVTRAQLSTEQKFGKVAVLLADLTETVKDLSEVNALSKRTQWSWVDMTQWCLEQKAKYAELTCPEVKHGNTVQFRAAEQESESLNRRFRNLQEKTQRAVQELDGVKLHDAR